MKLQLAIAAYLSILNFLFQWCLAWVAISTEKPPRYPSSRSCRTVLLHPLTATARLLEEKSRLEMILRYHGFDRRLQTLSTADLPLLAEVYVNGQSTLALVTSFHRSSGSKQEPKVTVEFLLGRNTQVVDIGQITTIWDSGRIDEDFRLEEVAAQAESLPAALIDRALDRLYRGRVGRARSSAGNLTKKNIAVLVQQLPEPDRLHAENVLRKVLKAGRSLSRLVDSAVARSYIRQERQDTGSPFQQQAVAAHVLSRDASTGGRFKRFPCVLYLRYPE